MKTSRLGKPLKVNRKSRVGETHRLRALKIQFAFDVVAGVRHVTTCTVKTYQQNGKCDCQQKTGRYIDIGPDQQYQRS